MNSIQLSYCQPKNTHISIAITGSKSESNRLLLLQALFPKISIENISESDDSVVLEKALQKKSGEIDIHHAGTAMRFLTAYFSTLEGSEVLLTGSERMQQRPIGVLVDALKTLGAHISYEAKEGFPPLRIQGTKITKKAVSIKANVSSQYISALMLIAPSFPEGLTINLEGKVTSVPYIKMTLSLLHKLGVSGTFRDNTIKIEPISEVKSTKVTVESDWSSASYFYSIVALSNELTVTLSNYKEKSFQGDSALQLLYKKLGVKTVFNEKGNSITLSKSNTAAVASIQFNLVDTPDIAQTIALTCFGLGIACELTGLHTLKIKETDRLVALQAELKKLGGEVLLTESSLYLKPSSRYNSNVTINTYNDHRMAMAFAPLALKIPLVINEPEVVSKSFPDFWEQLVKVGIISENK